MLEGGIVASIILCEDVISFTIMSVGPLNDGLEVPHVLNFLR